MADGHHGSAVRHSRVRILIVGLPSKSAVYLLPQGESMHLLETLCIDASIPK